VEVKPWSLVSASNEDRGEMWHGVGVTKNGFAIRFGASGTASPAGATVRLFDNNGNPTSGNIHIATLTGEPNTGGGGRGDGAGFHGNGTDAYVHLATGGGTPWITVLNANGTLRWFRNVAESYESINSDRVDAAISSDGRVVVVFDESVTGGVRLPQARLFSADGTPFGNRFWLSERDQPAPGGSATAESRRPRVAWRGGTIAAIWESLNSPATFNRVVAGRFFDVPVVAPPLQATIANAGASVTISWTGGGPTYSVIKRSPLNGTPQTIASGLTTTSYTTPKTESEAYYQVTSP
jgi:hypothetical protein